MAAGGFEMVAVLQIGFEIGYFWFFGIVAAGHLD